jgi:hypothetical protein
MELELKHLAGYLPYGLKCHCLGLYVEDEEENPIPLEVIICGLSNHCVEILGIKKTVTECFFINDVLPLLRPLSSLIKEIEVDGKRFVPMVELADIAYCDISDKNYKTAQDENSIGVSFNIENDENEFTHQVFAYSFTTKHFGRHLRITPHQKHLAEVEFVLHQLELFEKLHEWHFDIYGLIDKGLAIAIKD